MLDTLAAAATTHGVRLQESQFQQFQRYLDLLTEWNARVNLVADADPQVVQQRHFVESLALGATLREREVLRPDTSVIDVGAGAGFPGVVLKITWPTVRLTLLEATAKKTAFLSALIDALGFDATPVLTGRAEALAHDPALREHFDLVVARAVASLPALLELTLPFARVGGRVVTPKGSRAQEEISSAKRALEVLGARIFSLPLNVEGPPQTLVAAVKDRPTPPEYPRRDGVPAKSPL